MIRYFTATNQGIPAIILRITEITDKYLGKGKKVSNATRDQAEQISLIVFDLEELLNQEESE